MHGGELIADVLKAQGVPFLFTLCGGHISPILVAATRRGIRVIDTRHEATAVFAADAVARLSGRPGVAAVTAGPGLTNTVTAVKNAQMAQSPVVLLGGAAPTLLQGRGALQDVDQMALMRPHVKWARSVRRLRDLAPAVEEAFRRAQEGVPGPVFVECPIDILYPEELVRKLYSADGTSARGGGLARRALDLYLRWHTRRLFAGPIRQASPEPVQVQVPQPQESLVQQVAQSLARAQRPLLLIGSQALLDVARVPELVAAVDRLGIPVYLSGMARGLLGRSHPLQMRHRRRQALREADWILLAGVPCDFRLDYGRPFRRRATLVAVNRSRRDLTLNRRPDLRALADPGAFLRRLARLAPGSSPWSAWLDRLRERDQAREAEIEAKAREPVGKVNPLHLLQELERLLPEDAVLVADGGDFVATAAYILRPRGPLRWLDPGPFGTLGAGAGFALGAKLIYPDAEVWIVYGDGSAGYSLMEFDTFVRHRIPVIGLVGNDAGWAQIAREQVPLLGDPVATELAHSDYHRTVESFGAAGLHLDDPELAEEVLAQARAQAAAGTPALVNAILGRTDFRKGSISM